MVFLVVIYILFSFYGYQLWLCPIKSVFGINCPGCGLTHATLALLQGKWNMAVREHAFAPVFLAGLILTGGISILPGKWYQKSINGLAKWETRSGFFTFLMISLFGYWLIRLFLELF